MARPIGREVVEHWAVTAAGFNEPSGAQLVAEYRGCWVNPSTGSEGVAGHGRVSEVAQSVMVPVNVDVQGSDDYLIWQRHPEDKYRVDGLVERLYDRRGKLRLNTVPVRLVE